MMKKYVCLLMALCMPLAFVACSGGDDPIEDPVVVPPSTDEEEEEPAAPEYYTSFEPYVNLFCYERMQYYYLWWKDIEVGEWKVSVDPVEKVKSIRYEEDRWTAVYEEISPLMGRAVTTSGTFGYDFQFYWVDASHTHVYAVVTMVYPGSPAEKAGLKRGSVIKKMNGRNILPTNADAEALLSSPALQLTVALSSSDLNTPAQVNLVSKDMYLDPVLYEKVFQCEGKKVGYVFFVGFTMDCCGRLLEVAKKFKREGVTELILDLRYNGGGLVVTEELLASMLAPEADVKAGALYQTSVYNDTPYAKDLEKNKGKDFSNAYFKTKHEWNYNNVRYSYDTSDANMGLTKIYALVSGNSASASESILVGLMPFMDVEVIGAQTSGKHCTGIFLRAEDYFKECETKMAALKKTDPKEYAEYVDRVWRYFSAWKEYVGDWGLYAMINTYADRNGNNPCRPNGLKPDVEVEDDPRESYALGDDREALLREALTRAGYKDFTPMEGSKSRSAAVQLGEQVKGHRKEGRRILLSE